MGAPAARVAELSSHWASAGHEVTVLTGFPNHPTGVLAPEYRGKLHHLILHEEFHGVKVVRTWLLPFPNRKSIERILNYSSFCFSSALTGSFLPRPEVVIATSPQLLVGLSGWWLSRKHRIPFIFEVRDLWPESLVAVGVGNENSLLHRLLSKLAGFLYQKSHHIVVVTPAFKTHLMQKWGVPEEKITIVENGVETDLFQPRANDDLTAELRRSWNAKDKFVVCYIGTMGMAHGLETLLDVASQLQSSRPDILFVLVGEGAEKERILTMARGRNLGNVRFIDQQPREIIPAYINATDVCLVLLKKTDVFKTVIPTKMLEYMACGRPVILGVDGQARTILEEAQAGIFVEPENVDALRHAILKLAANLGLRSELSQNGRDYIVKNASRESTARTYIGALETIAPR